MSLGLGDLNKKRIRTGASSGAGATSAGPVTVKPGWARSKTARPWSSSGLAKAPQRRRITDTEAVMNEDWLSLHAEPLINTPFIQETKFSRIAMKLIELEEKLQVQLDTALFEICGLKREGTRD